MLDFTGVKAITIPEGNVVKITRGTTVLWEKPAVDEYKELEYLQFNKDMAFDTGHICTQNSIIIITFTRESTDAMYMYGVRNSANTASVTAYLSNSGAWRFGNTYRNFTISKDEKHSMQVNKSGLSLDGSFYKYGGTVSDFTTDHTLILGSSRSTSGSLSSPQFIGKIYDFYIIEDGKGALHWKPCQAPDGTLGFWDEISGRFIAPV